MSNEHISLFLDYYIGLSNPQYAVLLKGKWGSGKTYFINEYKEHLKTNEHKYIYVSLYGVTSYDEIETKFLEAVHPRLYNKKTIFAGKIAKQLLKGTLKIDFDDDGKADGNTSFKIPDFKPEDLLNTKDYILIFDDLERCSINIVDLLGYINFFVEHQSYKVILIANEEELKNTKKYIKIKEKLIGKTFKFKTKKDSAYDNFLLELKNTKKVKENILEKEKLYILEFFEKSLSNNLRTLRQSLLDFERFYDEILVSHLEKEDLIKDILKWFFIFSFEIRQGNTDILDLLKLSEEYHTLLIIDKNKEKAEKTKYKAYLNKYNFVDNLDVIISFDLWKEILINSNINKKEINVNLNNSKYYLNETIPSWKRLVYFYDLEDNEFKELLNNVYKKFCENKYAEFKHNKLVASCLLFFQEEKLFNMDSQTLFNSIQKRFEVFFETKIDIIRPIVFNKKLRLWHNQNYKNISYIESESFEKLNNYIDELKEKKKSLILKEDSKLIVKAIKDRCESKLFELLEGKNDIREVEYRNEPIFENIDIDSLFNAIINTNSQTMHCFGNIIKDRYSVKSKGNLLLEETFLKKMLKNIENHLEVKEFKLSFYFLEKEIKENFLIALKTIKDLKI